MNQSLIQQGWECPKCSRVYSPTQPMCMYCPQQSTIATTTTTPIGVGGSGTTTVNLHNFVSDYNGTAPKCIICGLEDWRHVTITNTYSQLHSDNNKTEL